VDQGATFTGTSSDDTFIGVDTSTATTFSALDAINGGAGTDTLNWVNTVGAITAAPAGASITGIEKVNLTSTQNVTLDTTTGWTGLTDLTATSSNKTLALTVASTTNTVVANSNAVANTVAVQGAKDVTVTVTGATATNAAANTGNTITVGATTTAPTGAVKITATSAEAATKFTGGISVTGGTSVDITANLTNSGAVNTLATIGDITVAGTALTTEVKVTQTATVAAAAAAAASANTNNAIAGTKGIAAGAVAISDLNAGSTTAPATIKTVTLANYGASTI
jgi:S-layer protein